MKSNCHNAPTRVEGDTTKFNVCTECEKACDVIEDAELKIITNK